MPSLANLYPASPPAPRAGRPRRRGGIARAIAVASMLVPLAAAQAPAVQWEPFVTVGGATLANDAYWEEMCALLPTDAWMLRLTMGTAVDLYRWVRRALAARLL